ncbi:MAG: TonB-dependent receptor plug domain-containing protein, partial [Aridibacter sp.]
MKFISSLFLLWFLAIGIFAQTEANLRGKITLIQTPERDATITLVSQTDETIKFSTQSDENGNFSFENIPAGKYILKASIASPLTRSVSIWANDKKVTLKKGNNKTVVELQSTLQIIRETVTVSADATQPVSEVSKTVNVIDEEEVTNRNEITLTDTLRTIPGFRVQQLGGFGRTASIKTRGLRNQDTAILIDGIRFRDPASITGDASAFLSDSTTANIGRVEVLRGSGSSIYGTNAIGGVIDFQTPIPRKEFNGSFASEYGGLGLTRFRGDVGSGTSDGKLAFTTGFSKTRFTRGIDGDDDADNLNL